MATAKVSSKYQVVIPREIRNSMGIRPGDEIEMFRAGENRIEMVRVKDIKKSRGFLKGMDTMFEREDDRL